MPDPRETADSEDFDEYLVECDEHLAAVRRELLALEALADPGAVGRETLDALFRAFHTIKGLSGMVGVRAAEEVAHLLETYLTAVRNGDVRLTERGVEALLDGVALVEASIGAVQHGEPPPNTASLAARVAKLLPSTPDGGSGSEYSPGGAPGANAESDPAPGFRTSLSAEEQSRLDAALLRGERAWRITFSPAAELAARGVNVGTLRVRLQGAGEIVHAEPVPTPGGVSFRFLFTTGAEFDPAVLTGEGVVAEPFEPPVKRKNAQSPAAAGLAPANLVRVDLRRLDDVMRTVGELVLSRARLESGLAKIAGYLPVAARRELEETALGIERHLRVLREEVMRVRMTPVRDLFARMRLVVRDLTRETGKEVELTTTGEETEVDKFVIERMADSLLHLVRNAVSHGLESPAERRAAGKPPKGRIELRAATAGGMIVLEVEDDGRGVLAEEAFARAREAGLVPPDAAADPAAVLDLLCTPGFSTRGEADLASGRGVGMDVVRRSVEGLGGTLSLHTNPGAGSRFTA
ncbi:MAG TPA: Hpt domain-containing protein, partial [Planctomycetia bacterium]|nr:Hpt domain-containing protein [Planctomycetia bacterium]